MTRVDEPAKAELKVGGGTTLDDAPGLLIVVVNEPAELEAMVEEANTLDDTPGLLIVVFKP